MVVAIDLLGKSRYCRLNFGLLRQPRANSCIACDAAAEMTPVTSIVTAAALRSRSNVGPAAITTNQPAVFVGNAVRHCRKRQVPTHPPGKCFDLSASKAESASGSRSFLRIFAIRRA